MNNFGQWGALVGNIKLLILCATNLRPKFVDSRAIKKY